MNTLFSSTQYQQFLSKNIALIKEKLRRKERAQSLKFKQGVSYRNAAQKYIQRT